MKDQNRPTPVERPFRLIVAATLTLGVLFSFPAVEAWSNGGYSADPNNPDYGTHDWIAERALDWLPANERVQILTYRTAYLFGTELPDNAQAADGIGDTTLHHVYFFMNGTLQDDAAARRASETQSQAAAALAAGNLADAAKWTGAMTHYIADMAVFGHVMGSATEWGSEQHHSDYEDYVNTRTDTPDEAEIQVSFDGVLATTSPYDVALSLGHDTTFDLSGAGRTAIWMDQHYNWSDPAFIARAYQSVNLAVNYVAEAVNAVWSTVAVTTTTTFQQTTTPSSIGGHVVINEVELNPPGSDAGNEWVELYNPTNTVVDLTGWAIRNRAAENQVSVPVPPEMMGPKGYCIVTHPTQWLDNQNETLTLLDKDGHEIDQTPWLNDTKYGNQENYSWQRYPNGQDTDTDSDWVFQIGTMNVSNGGESVVTTTTTQQQTTTTTTSQQVTTSTTQVETTTTSTQQQTTTATTQQHTTTQTQQTALLTSTTLISTTSVAAQGSGLGFAFVAIGIGAGIALALAGFAIAAKPRMLPVGPMNYCRYCGRHISSNSRLCQFCRRSLL